jgi:hypothetical protein
MSWVDAVQSQLIIKTGDGKSFTPLWKNSCAKEIEYNIAQFDFPKIAGSLINRGTPTARKFSLEIYFQGDNNLDDSLSFEISANDPRPWSISHPIYGSVLVQPVGLKFDYSGYNVTQITGTVIETLGSAGLKITVVPIDKINADKETLDETQAASFDAVQALLQSRELTASDLLTSSKEITTLKGLNKTFYDIGVKQVKLTEDAGKYFNYFNVANSAVDQLINSPLQAIQAVQAMVNFPGMMVTSIKTRITVLQQQLKALGDQILLQRTNANKKIYEVLGGGLISTIVQASITSYDPVNELLASGILPDYKNRTDVLTAIDSVQGSYNDYLTNLDLFQTSNGGSEDSYIPDAESLTQINSLVNFALSSLSSIALDAKQQRTVVLGEDSNVIILAHRFYGLQADDSTIDTLIENNNIYLNELLQIKKGRTLVYYI